MFQLTTCLLLAALHASRTAAEVPETCQENYNGFSVTEDTYANQLVTFQVASSPPSLNITNHYLTLDTPTPYPDILNLTITPLLSSATHFNPIYQRATQNPKSGSWSCAWHKFLPPNDNGTLGGSISDVQLSVLDWNPSPLLMTSWTALKNNLKQDWRYVAYGFKVLSNGEGDTRVRNSEGRGTFLAYKGDEGRVLVGYAEVYNESDYPIELRIVVVGNRTIA